MGSHPGEKGTGCGKFAEWDGNHWYLAWIQHLYPTGFRFMVGVGVSGLAGISCLPVRPAGCVFIFCFISINVTFIIIVTMASLWCSHYGAIIITVISVTFIIIVTMEFRIDIPAIPVRLPSTFFWNQFPFPKWRRKNYSKMQKKARERGSFL